MGLMNSLSRIKIHTRKLQNMHNIWIMLFLFIATQRAEPEKDYRYTTKNKINYPCPYTRDSIAIKKQIKNKR